MKIIKHDKNQALNEIANFFRTKKIMCIEDALKFGVAVDCSRSIGKNEYFIVTVEFCSKLTDNKDLIEDLKILTRTNMKWHITNSNDKIFVGFIDDPQLTENRCSFFIIEKFLNEIISIAS